MMICEVVLFPMPASCSRLENKAVSKIGTNIAWKCSKDLQHIQRAQHARRPGIHLLYGEKFRAYRASRQVLFGAFGEFAKVADVTSVYQRSIRKAAKLNLLPRQKFDAKEQPIKDTCTEIGCHNMP